MGLDDDGLNVLEEQLLADPQKGAVIEGTGGARKLRIQVEYRVSLSNKTLSHYECFHMQHHLLSICIDNYIHYNLTRLVKKNIAKQKTMKEKFLWFFYFHIQ